MSASASFSSSPLCWKSRPRGLFGIADLLSHSLAQSLQWCHPLDQTPSSCETCRALPALPPALCWHYLQALPLPSAPLHSGCFCFPLSTGCSLGQTHLLVPSPALSFSIFRSQCKWKSLFSLLHLKSIPFPLCIIITGVLFFTVLTILWSHLVPSFVGCCCLSVPLTPQSLLSTGHRGTVSKDLIYEQIKEGGSKWSHIDSSELFNLQSTSSYFTSFNSPKTPKK